MRNIFFDLDGTLLNSLDRLYSLFCKLAPKNKFSFEEYWNIKHQKIDQKSFLIKYLQYSPQMAEEFRKNWLNEIEDQHLLKLDKPFQFSTDLLKQIYKNNNLYIVTARQDELKAIEQISHFGWDKLVKKILVTKQNITKAQIIKNNVGTLDGRDIIIGDTGEDIISGKELGIKTIAVTSGALGKEVLSTYKPDFISSGINEIYQTNYLHDNN